MRVKICDIYNTKYFYVTMGRDLSYMWNTCLALQKDSKAVHNVGNPLLGTIYECFKTGAPVEFDLAGARITSDVTYIILNFLNQGIVMCDSESKWRDTILKENMRRFAIHLETVPLPTYNLNNSVKEYIQNLQTDVIYQPPVTELEVYLPLLTMITILRPNVTICLNNIGISFMNYVATKVPFEVLERYDELFMVTPEGIQRVHKDNIYVQNLGKVSLFEAMSVANFVPAVFGSERLFTDPAFREIFNSCLATINRYRSTRKPLISDILGE